MKTKSIIRTVLAVSIMLFMVVPASAECKHGKHSKKGMEKKFYYKAHFLLSHEDELKLSDEQHAKIKALKLSTKKELIKQNADIDIIKVDVHAGLYERSIDVKALNALVDQKYEIKKAKAKTLVAAVAELKGILTDEQYTNAKALMKAAH